jgi:glutathione S-transferase
MPELFEFPPTRSNRAKWALEELEVVYTSRSVDVRIGEHRVEPHLRVHPPRRRSSL